MSSESTTGNPGRYLTFSPSVRFAAVVWGSIIALTYIVYVFTKPDAAADRPDQAEMQMDLASIDSKSAAPRVPTQSFDASTDSAPTGQPAPRSELSDAARRELARVERVSEQLGERLASLESSIQRLDARLTQALDQPSVAESRQAVAAAQTAVVSAKIASCRRYLDKIKRLSADWETRFADLLTNETGRRIAASPAHVRTVHVVLQQEPPAQEQLVQWELQTDALGEPFENKNEQNLGIVSVTQDHIHSIDALHDELVHTSFEFERQQLLLERIVRETTNTPPAQETLEQVLTRVRQEQAKEEADRVASILAQARAQAIEEQAAKIAALEKEVIQAETDRQAKKLEAEKRQIEQLTELDRQELAEQTRVKEQERKARIAQLKAAAEQAAAAIEEAALEREFEKSLPDIKRYLAAFITPGVAYRRDGTTGPFPYSVIEAAGALAPDRKGMEALLKLVNFKNDRPRGPLPYFQGSDLGWQRTNKEPIAKAQELLKRFGPLMVKKGMLAP